MYLSYTLLLPTKKRHSSTNCLKSNCNTHLMAFFPGQPGQAGTRKVKPFWVLMKQDMVGWQ